MNTSVQPSTLGGLGLFTTTGVAAEESLVTIPAPELVGVNPTYLPHVCYGCFKRLRKRRQHECEGCNRVRFCSQQCQDHTTEIRHHEDECKAFQTIADFNELHGSYFAVLAFCLAHERQLIPNATFRNILNLHCDTNNLSQAESLDFQDWAREIRVAARTRLAENVIFRLFVILRWNAFEITNTLTTKYRKRNRISSSYFGEQLLLNASRLNHACSPNSRLDGVDRANSTNVYHRFIAGLDARYGELVSETHIAAGRELNISYCRDMNGMENPARHKAFLLRNWMFTCPCIVP